MLQFDDFFRDGIPSRCWSCKGLIDSKANWMASGLFIKARDPFTPSWVCVLSWNFYLCGFFIFVDGRRAKGRAC